MTERKVGASVLIVVGLMILFWWFTSDMGALGLFNDCWIGGFCYFLMIPGAVGLIILVIGFWILLRNDEENS